MSIIQEYHVRNKLFLISMENFAVKIFPFTLVLHGAFGFSFVLGSWETEQLDIEHHFLILSEFHNRGFQFFHKEN